MKDLAIYGCSFASRDAPYGWSYLLQQDNPTGVDIYAEGGSGIDWSFNNFLNTHSDYKQIVFIATSHGRVHYPIECTNKKDGTVKVFEHWPGINTIEWVMKHYKSKNNMLEDLFKFYVDFFHHQYKYARNTNKAIIRYIKFTRPDAIIIPAFRQVDMGETPDPELDLEYNEWTLYDISLHETSKFQTEATENLHEFDIRCNHLSQRSNEWVKTHVEARLAGEFLNWRPELTPMFENLEDYYRSKD